MASMKIEIRRNSNEAWFMLCHVGTVVEASRIYNQQRARGYKVRISNSETSFVVQEDK